MSREDEICVGPPDLRHPRFIEGRVTWRHVTPEAMTYDKSDFAPNMK